MVRPGVVIVAIVLFVIPAASASEVEPVLRSMANVLDMAYEIERYSLQHGRLPAATSPADLSQVLLGTDSMTELLVDAWGTPLHIYSNPDSNAYVVASAGADKQFDRELWTVRAATRSAADDIVVRDGEMVRWPEEWVVARFRAEGGDPARALQESIESSNVARTMTDLTMIAIAMEQYVSEHGTLPAANDIASLDAALEPDLPDHDAWGRPFAVRIDRDAKTYRVVSAGTDGKFDEKRWSETGETLDYTRDAVLQNHELTAKWQVRVPGRELRDAYSYFALFKTKYVSLRMLGDDERRKLRLEGLAKDMDAAAERQDFFGAMSLYEEAEKLGVRHTERLHSWALSFTLNTPPPPGQPVPPRLMEDARQRAAAGRIAAALRRTIAETAENERWPLIETLADLERERGDAEEADRLLNEYAAANPGNPRPWLRQLSVALRDGDTAGVLRLIDRIVKLEPADKDALHAVGVTFYEVLAKAGDTISVDQKRRVAAHARLMFERAAKLDPNAMEPVAYLGLTLRQEALIETDRARAAKLVEEADALRNRAIEISRRRRAEQ